MTAKRFLLHLVLGYASFTTALAQAPEVLKTSPQIRSVIEEVYYVGKGEHTKPPLGAIYKIGFDEKYYDKEGRLIKKMYDDPTLSCLRYEEYKRYVYNDKGQLIETIELDFEGKDSGCRTLHSYNSKGQYIYSERREQKWQNNRTRAEVITKTIQRKYNAQGLLSQEVIYNVEEKQSKCNTYLYNNDGKLIEEKSYDAKGNEHHRKVYTYNNSGQKTEEQEFTSGKQRNHLRWTYDSKGRLVEHIDTRNNGLVRYKPIHENVHRYVYRYDEADRLIEKYSYGKGDSLYLSLHNTYNDKGQLIKKRKQSYNIYKPISEKDRPDIRIYFYDYNDRGELIDELRYHSYAYTKELETLQSIPEILASDKAGSYQRIIYTYSYDRKGRLWKVVTSELPRFPGFETKTTFKTIEYYEDKDQPQDTDQ